MIPFLISYLLTAAALGGVVWSGFQRRRSLHYKLVAATLALLAIAIYFAEKMGRSLVFTGAAATVKDVHMGAVWITFALLPLLVVSGVTLARADAQAEVARRRTHRWLAFAFLAGVVLSTGLGIAMTALATPA